MKNYSSISTPNKNCHGQKQPSRGVLRKRCSENIEQIYRRTNMPECDFNKVAKQLSWNRTSAWVFCCKLGAYFQNTRFPYFLFKGDMINIFYCQNVYIFTHERHCWNVLPCNVSIIYNLQDSLNHFIILVLLGSEWTSSPFINYQLPPWSQAN